MFLPCLVSIVLATPLAFGTAIAQQKSELPRCSETVERLDRKLNALSERLAREHTAKIAAAPVPAARVMAELIEMVALREHLRCLGFRARKTSADNSWSCPCSGSAAKVT